MSGVLLISRFNHLRIHEKMNLHDAVMRGTEEELRPILMMMLVAMLGLIPASLATGIGSDVQRPLATVIVGGLASALILTLLVLPALYYQIELRSKHNELAVAMELEELEEKQHEKDLADEHHKMLLEKRNRSSHHENDDHLNH